MTVDIFRPCRARCGFEYEGAINLVMNHGDRREPIFRDDVGRKRFLETAGENSVKTDWQLHARAR